MANPTLAPVGELLYDEVAPLAWDDEKHGHALAHYCGALGAPLELLAAIAGDDEAGRPGWGVALSPTDAPAELLPWLAQFAGVRVPPGMTEAELRRTIEDRPRTRRGRPGTIAAAVRETLTGERRVLLQERHGSPYALTVTTWVTDTPDPAATLAAALAEKPAGLSLTHSVISGGDYRTLRDTHDDYADVRETFDDYADVRSDPSRT